MHNDLPNRQTIRLPNYDYSRAGYYFITICTQHRRHYFGEILGATLCGRPNTPNHPHIMIEYWLLELENKFKDVKISEYVVMPNHVHFIVEKTGDHDTGDHNTGDHDTGDHDMGDHDTGDHDTGDHDTGDHDAGDHDTGDHAGSPLRDIVGWFKTMTTNDYIRGVKQGLYEPFEKRLWQRNYYEHIIRDEQDYINNAEYIRNNPKK